MNAAPTYVLTIEQHQEKQRVDQLLSTHPVIQESRAQIQRWIQQGAVQLNGRSPKPSERVKQGDVLTLHVPPPQSYSVKAQAIDLDVVFEDEHLIVINKPVGMVVHPAPGHPDHTLVNALLHHCGDLSGIGGVLRPGIVHRLDKETSGLMVAAKHDRAHQSLAALFKNKDPQQLDRRYLAIVRGQVKDASG
ncbi:MAG: RluA family pseudouridine synthase, partial [Myxococcota bacterium]